MTEINIKEAAQAKKTKKPYVVIFGDDEGQSVAKQVWSFLSGNLLQMISAHTVEELEESAQNAVMIMIVTQGVNDKNNDLTMRLARNPRVTGDIVAVTDEKDVGQRVKILAKGFDAIFDVSFMEYPEFKEMLLNRIERGFISLENRIQQEEYRRFKASLAASPDAFIVFDENRKIFFVSEHYRKAYPTAGPRLIRGVDVMDAFEMCVNDEYVDHSDPRYEAMHEFWSTLEGQVEHVQNDGRTWSIKAKKLPEGQGTIVTTTDITSYRNQQRELEEQSQKLATALEKEQEASAIQKQFINMVSHEFRTPLSIIDGNAQILFRRARTLDEETIKKRTKTIRSAVSRLVNMMEGVLSSNMLNTGKLQLVREPVDLKQMIQELCDEHADLSSSLKIKCRLDALQNEVFLDRKLFTLVISNLLSNAIKFSPDNPDITVTARQDDLQLVLTFEDKGIGIPANETDKIFNRYYRTTTSSGIPGSGIGLNLAKDLVELHGGTIKVESELGKGTKFVITLPVTV